MVGRNSNNPIMRQLPKRFYSSVLSEERNIGWCILLDGKPVRTPRKQIIGLTSEALVKEIAREWEAQVDFIDASTMPITCIVNTGIDYVNKALDEVKDEIVKFANNDLLCYRVDNPRELTKLQNKFWNNPLDWLSNEHSVSLQITTGIMPMFQPISELNKFRNLLHDLHELELAALQVAVTLTGSAVLGYAVFTGVISSEAAWAAAHVDEDWQIAQWGEDSEAKLRRKFRWNEFRAATKIMMHLKEK
ncbi:MAG: hypothetical protein TECD_00698 [Hyphomicrobiaceae bacterium hypho_1]